MKVNRIAIGDEKLVYVICADKNARYPKGRSLIVYIGTTRNGIARVAQSAAYHADDVLHRHGISSFEVRIVTCGARQRVRSWHKLERAMLLVFREKFGSVPICNTVGKNFAETTEFKLFSKLRVSAVIASLTESGMAHTNKVSR